VADVQRTAILPVPPPAVWRALTDGEQLSAWFGGEVEIDAFPGGQLAVRAEGRVRRAVIVDFDPGHRLAFRWLPPHRRVGFVWAADETEPGTSGEVEFTLEEVPAGTRLTVVETAPAVLGTSALARAGAT
jgi:uncharacterized protein YndB with AHSA1/START domain